MTGATSKQIDDAIDRKFARHFGEIPVNPENERAIRRLFHIEIEDAAEDLVPTGYRIVKENDDGAR